MVAKPQLSAAVESSKFVGCEAMPGRSVTITERSDGYLAGVPAT